MVWHIFKKDWKLAWGFVMAVASLHWIAAFVKFRLGVAGENEALTMLSQVLPGLSIFSGMFLTCAIVHLDAIPGVKQDWLARPIPRGSLLREKFLFVITTVCGPMFVGNLFLGVANGFGFRSAFFQATIFAAYLFFFTVLPIFALAAVTRNMTMMKPAAPEALPALTSSIDASEPLGISRVACVPDRRFAYGV